MWVDCLFVCLFVCLFCVFVLCVFRLRVPVPFIGLFWVAKRKENRHFSSPGGAGRDRRRDRWQGKAGCWLVRVGGVGVTHPLTKTTSNITNINPCIPKHDLCHLFRTSPWAKQVRDKRRLTGTFPN